MIDDFDPVTYAEVNKVWAGVKLAPITVAESHVLCRKLLRKFGPKNKLRPGRILLPWFLGRPNRSWGRTTESYDRHHVRQGLPKMVHDTSHWVHEKLHPHAKTHCAPHAALEKAMAEHVVAQGWHLPKAKPVAPPKPSKAEVRAGKLAQTDAAIRRWETKAKRAATALRKLRRRKAGLERALAVPVQDCQKLAGGPLQAPA